MSFALDDGSRPRAGDGPRETARGGDAGASWTSLPILAYEEEPPVVKTREEVLAGKLALLKGYTYAPKEAPESDPSGAGVYLDVCESIHRVSYMKFPTTGVAADVRAERETLDLSHAGLGRKGAAALAAALRINSSTTSLVLTGNYITASGAVEIVRAVNESRAILSVDFSANRLGRSEMTPGVAYPIRGGAAINELLGPGSTLTQLFLRGNQLTDTDIALFADTLAENVTLQTLDLSENKLGPAAATSLASMLSRNSDLRTINLEWNQFGPSACRLLLADGFLQNNTIKSFNLSSCGLDDVSAPLIARILTENATEDLTLANNRLTATGAEVIAKAFTSESSLVSLILDGNNLGETGCLALVTAAMRCHEEAVAHGSAKSFRLLSMQHCGCSPETEEAFRNHEANKADAGIRLSEGFGRMIVA